MIGVGHHGEDSGGFGHGAFVDAGDIATKRHQNSRKKPIEERGWFLDGLFSVHAWVGGLIGYRGQVAYVHIDSIAIWPDFSIGKMNVCIVFLGIGSGVGARFRSATISRLSVTCRRKRCGRRSAVCVGWTCPTRRTNESSKTGGLCWATSMRRGGRDWGWWRFTTEVLGWPGVVLAC